MSTVAIRTAPLGERDLGPALGLLQEAYAAERLHSPLLPAVLLGDPRLAEPALLNACIGWARAQNFERLMVEHETANLLGSAFWGRHFSPYLTFSMRCVEA
jgi:hypothetical protein